MPVSTAALIARGQTFFFVRRPPGGDLGECWELPGGKADPGETPHEALRRELHEELGITARVGELAGTAAFEHQGEQFELQGYYVSAGMEGLHLKEHTEVCWRTLEDALSLDLAPSDRSLIARILAAGSELLGT